MFPATGDAVFIPRCRVPTGHVSDQGGRVSRTFKLQQKTYENILSQLVKITAGFSTAFACGILLCSIPDKISAVTKDKRAQVYKKTAYPSPLFLQKATNTLQPNNTVYKVLSMADDMVDPEVTFLCSAGLFPWWLILLWGLLILIIGVMFITTPVITTEVVITFMGAFWLVGGLFSLGSLAVDRTNMGLKIFLAVINIFAGALILVRPLLAAIFVVTFFVIFIGFFACFIGCAHLFTAFKNKDAGNAVLGVISLIFGILLLTFPLVTAALLPYIAGGFCIIAGISGIITSFMAKKAQAVVTA